MTQIQIAMTWYNDEAHFKKAQRMMPDLADKTYADFLREMNDPVVLQMAEAKGLKIIRQPIDLEAFAEWCMARCITKMDGNARAAYTQDVAFSPRREQPGLVEQKITGSQFAIAFTGENGWMITSPNANHNWYLDDIESTLSALPDGAEIVFGITRNGIEHFKSDEEPVDNVALARERAMFRKAKDALKAENYKRRDAGRRRLKLIRVVSSEELLSALDKLAHEQSRSTLQ